MHMYLIDYLSSDLLIQACANDGIDGLLTLGRLHRR